MSVPDGIKRAWQALSWNMQVPPFEDVQRSARSFDRKIRLRNRMEYGAGGFAIVMFSIGTFMEPLPLMRLANALIALATCFVLWQLSRRASVPEPPTSVATSELLGHHRRHLERQRDALQSVWLWYLLPFVPGFTLSIFADPFIAGKAWMKATAIIAVFGGVWWLNWRAARKLQKAIDELDELAGEAE